MGLPGLRRAVAVRTRQRSSWLSRVQCIAAVAAGHFIRDGIVPMVTVERLEYRPHRYVPSDDQPADALHARCHVCYGTHGEDKPTHPVVGSESTSP
ncbi:hypothetical protein CLV70_101199 [Pseudosporangium ferrugineum]|uniref:Uncharacterized protein n=1 Tax=Pseudosporangium ferrugineum TaxID=439699 RepID=A0A2T0SHZ2_9ACTN|nr:hypothetical protein CLV70_101199 [Pseudosporangium ferrugineum]